MKRIKIAIGSAAPLEEELVMEVKGRDMVAGLPKTITVNSDEIREALTEPISTIVEAARVALENSPPELSADLVDRGIIKAGSARILETSLAFNLGDFTDRRVAEGKRSQYMNRWRIPAYIFQLEIRDETPVYRLYAGAFEEREQSSFLADRIEEAGLSRVLVERLGSWPLR